MRILQNIFSYQLHSSDLAIVKMLKAGSEFSGGNLNSSEKHELVKHIIYLSLKIPCCSLWTAVRLVFSKVRFYCVWARVMVCMYWLRHVVFAFAVLDLVLDRGGCCRVVACT